MNKRIIILLALFLCSNSSVFADDFAEIKGVLQKYIDGTSQGKPELVEEAFLPTLEVQYVWEDGVFRRITGSDYIANIKPGIAVDRVANIASIEVTGNAAIAKITIIFKQEHVYTDYLLLLKLNDGWRVSNKIATRRLK
jgi:Putative lumazine-binding|tara:strand:+ start:101004 stop:101420 length:417 start_codon:yes stop_codon:yes gene_type:complete